MAVLLHGDFHRVDLGLPVVTASVDQTGLTGLGELTLHLRDGGGRTVQHSGDLPQAEPVRRMQSDPVLTPQLRILI